VSVSSGSKQLKDVSLLLDSALAAHPSYITGSTPAGKVLATSPSGARFILSHLLGSLWNHSRAIHSFHQETQFALA